MLDHVMRQAQALQPVRTFVVVGHSMLPFCESRNRDEVQFVLQEEQRGTGHAVLQVAPHLSSLKGDVLVLNGDHPLILEETLIRLREKHQESQACMTVLSATMEDPTGYGRILRDKEGSVLAIREERDASAEEKVVREVNTGTYLFSVEDLFTQLPQLNNQNAQQEYYLPDLLSLFRQQQQRVSMVPVMHPTEALGVNNRRQLAVAEKVMRQRILERHWENGVTIIDPDRTYIEAEVQIGSDTTLYPDTFLRGHTQVEEGCVLGPGLDAEDTWFGSGARVRYAVLEKVRLAKDVKIGPYVYLRPGVELAEGVKIGAFVDMKKATVGAHSKVSHLAYVGDAEIGAGVNIGCGVVTANYDGQKKHLTKVEDEAFVGCNVNLVAPVVVGKKSWVAAGSTITEDVPSGSLAIARGRQVTKLGYVERRLEKELK